jgi:carbon-monoxide dehydrogenase small subunit
MSTLTLTVNGKNHTGSIEPRTLLVDFLREQAGLTGTHIGCSHGVCGACTVLVDGATVRGCLMLAIQAEGSAIQTVEGLAAPGGQLHAIQQAMHECHGVQCGFCTPGILMTLFEFLQENAHPTEIEVREALSGNLCRCTGYQGIVDAALLAAVRMR